METGEALGIRQRNIAEEMLAITVMGNASIDIGVADRIVLLMIGVQQNASGGKGPDR